MSTDMGTTRSGARVPPHSREAEESVLGAVLLSIDAANEVMDRLDPEDFYIPAHQSIYESMKRLYDTNQAIDAVTLSEELRRAGELEKVGGVSYLTRLVDVVPVTSNVDNYARIVDENSRRRDLIRAGGTVTSIAFDLDDEIHSVMDRAEQTVLGVAEKRVSQNLLEVGPLFSEVLEQIEFLEQQGSEITGLATGFRDLDRELAGLQNANLIIIAARPAMGKSALALNIAANAATQGKPVAVFSLEMSKEELVQRILSSVGRVDSKKLRSGQLGPLWQRVVDAASRMYKAPIFIDDSPVVTVTDIRAKTRRLKRKSGLSLVVVDYLQLMQGSLRENRQQEIAEISRNLKNLARELDVPIIGLSQLNRALESREDKRPRLSDLRESGCMPASTRLVRADTGAEVTLGELVLSQEQPLVWSVDDDWRLVPRRLLKAFASGVKPVFRLRTASGYEVEATANHRFLTVDGWVRLDELAAGSHLAVPRVEHEPATQQRWDDDELALLAHDGFVPAEIFGLPSDQVGFFLHHLWVTNGSVTLTRDERGRRVRIDFASTNRRLVEDTRRLLLRLGIRARISRAHRAGCEDTFRLRISGRDAQVRFLELVAGHGEGGGVVAQAMEILGGARPHPDGDLVPWGAAARVRVGAVGGADPGPVGTAHLPRRLSRQRLERMGQTLGDDHLVELATSDVFWDQIVEIVPVGEMPTFDATVDGTHNFIANGVIAHNSLEQDADVVMFIYRNEYYHPEDQESKGLAEVIIAKHRAGATGTVRMTFLPEFTRFADLGRDVT